MTSFQRFGRLLLFASRPVVIYIAVLGIALTVTVWAMIGISVDLQSRASMLEEYERRESQRNSRPNKAEPVDRDWPVGSAFLDGQTVTMAGAAILQQVTVAIARFGGTIISSELEPRSLETRTGFVKALANCEIDPRQLHALLYELEAGMPFLFIEQLSVQDRSSTGESAKLTVSFTISGMWIGQDASSTQ